MNKKQKSIIKQIVRQALKEDVGPGDITTLATVEAKAKAKGVVLAKEAGVIAGLWVAKEVFRQVDSGIKFAAKVEEGARVKKGKILAAVSGPARGILTGERVALNFLQRLSGIATLTSQFEAKVKGCGAKILDTRKTTPGLRMLEKYAVRTGGGTNHRFGLYDAFLIKDNHIALAGGVKRAVEGARKLKTKRAIEVEAKSIAQVEESIDVGADKILLDNMDLNTLRKAVKLCKKALVSTEASGGVNLKTVRNIAKTGVNSISVGALTHSAKALDISLEIG
jgi:nicotinate-nucleotide pyrophosphorylase (carboxylating)